MPGNQGRFNYLGADWIEIGQQPAAYNFPESYRERPENLNWALEHPDNLLHGALEVMEHETSCLTGPPNLYIKVSAAKPISGKKYSKRELRDLDSRADIETISPGGCPSWEASPTARPAECTEWEEQREAQGGSGVQ
jgi:hypothetical protein